MNIKSYQVFSTTLLVVLTSSSSAPAARAAEAPFGEPELVLPLPPPQATEVEGPLPLAEDLAVLLQNGELFRTDATVEGSYSIHPSEDIVFDRILYPGGQLVWLDGRTRFGTREGSFWRTDGTASGTLLLRDHLLTGGYDLHPQLGLLFFAGGLEDPEDLSLEHLDVELWFSDGTAEGTRLVRDLWPEGSSAPSAFEPLGDEMLFLATDPQSHRRALWRSDGTAAGTRLVALPDDESFRQLWVIGTTAYLESVPGSADSPGRSLWRSDGTTAGTRRLKTFDEAFWVALSADLGDGRTLWTTLEDLPVGDSAALWISEGTAESTVRLMPLSLPSLLDYPRTFVPYHGLLYFDADDGETGDELWRTDGTPEGTRVAFETCPGPCSDFGGLHTLQEPGTLLIWASDPERGMELRTTDGTAEGTELLLDLCPGPCSTETAAWQARGGFWLFAMNAPPEATFPEGTRQFWATDRTPEGLWQLTDFDFPVGGTGDLTLLPVNGKYLFIGGNAFSDLGVWALVPLQLDPPLPLGDWLASSSVPGFSFKVRISGGPEPLLGTLEPACIPETVCASGAVPGRSEVFLRVVGPKPNGRLWPTLVKFSTSPVEVWVRQEASGAIRYYRLEGARPGHDELPGLFDREGFEPISGASSGANAAASARLTVALAAGAAPAPSGPVFTSEHFPDFRFRVRITAGDQVQEVRKEGACIPETLCLSAAVPGRSEAFVRIVGPKPNGRLWPTMVKFTTSTLEVWVEQVSTGETKYYRIEGAAPGEDDLTGLFDRTGFVP